MPLCYCGKYSPKIACKCMPKDFKTDNKRMTINKEKLAKEIDKKYNELKKIRHRKPPNRNNALYEMIEMTEIIGAIKALETISSCLEN